MPDPLHLPPGYRQQTLADIPGMMLPAPVVTDTGSDPADVWLADAVQAQADRDDQNITSARAYADLTFEQYGEGDESAAADAAAHALARARTLDRIHDR